MHALPKSIDPAALPDLVHYRGHGIDRILEYAPNRVRVNAIPPGLIKSPMVEKGAGLAKAYGGGDVEEMWRVRGRQVPMEFNGDARVVAWAAVYLASDESRATSPASNSSSTTASR